MAKRPELVMLDDGAVAFADDGAITLADEGAIAFARFLTLLAYLGDATRRRLAVAAYEFAGVAGLGRRRHHGGVGGLRSRSGLSIRRLCGCGCARPLWLLGGGSGRLRLLCGRWRRPLRRLLRSSKRARLRGLLCRGRSRLRLLRGGSGRCRLRLLRGRWCRPLRRLLRSCRRTRRMRLLCRGWRCLWLRLLRGRWCRPLRRLLRSCRRTRRMRLLCRGRRCLWLRLLRGRRSWRTAAIVTPFLRGRGRRLPGRLLRGRRCGLRRLLLGCRCLLRLLLRGRRLRWRAAAAFGRALLAALLRRRRLWRGWGGLRLRTLSRRSRRSSGWRRLSLGWCLWCLRAWRRGRRLWLYLGRHRRPGLLRCSRRLSGLVGRFGRCSLRYDERPIERRGKSSRKAALQSSAARCWSTAAN